MAADTPNPTPIPTPDRTSDLAVAYQHGMDYAQKGQIIEGARGIRHVLVPKDHTLAQLGYCGDKPLDIAGTATLQDIDSWAEYVNWHKLSGQTMAMFDREQSRFVAIVNGHEVIAVNGNARRQPDWCDHLAIYALELSAEWQEWTAMAAQSHSQCALADFLEDHLSEIASPPAGQFLAAVQTLQIKNDVQFTGVVPTNGGLQVSYREEQTATAGGAKETLLLPNEFTLAMPIHTGGKNQWIKAKLRYTLRDGKLTFTVKLMAVEKAVRDAEQELIDKAGELTGLTILKGSFKPTLTRPTA